MLGSYKELQTLIVINYTKYNKYYPIGIFQYIYIIDQNKISNYFYNIPIGIIN